MTASTNKFSEGLQDIIAAESSICLIDGINSKLSYRGYDIHELCDKSNFEEVVYLLHHGKLPSKKALADFSASLAAEREIPKALEQAVLGFPKSANPMAVLRTAISLLSFYDPEAEDKSLEANFRKAMRLMAKTPTLIAIFERGRKGLAVVPPKKDASISSAANFLYMMKGKDATPVEVKMLDKYFVLLAEHDLNASTFAARIAASTQSDIFSAVSGAIGTLKGDLHGSANTRAMEGLLAIGDIHNVEAFVEDAIANKKKIMGFGHRMYKGPDPRAFDLRNMAKALADANAEQAKWFAISEKLERLVMEKKKLNCNVDFYSASILYTLGIAVDLFTPFFASSRMAGWTAHVLEQYANNRLIRPISQYTGLVDQVYTPIENRS
jgi:citrate synthase